MAVVQRDFYLGVFIGQVNSTQGAAGITGGQRFCTTLHFIVYKNPTGPAAAAPRRKLHFPACPAPLPSPPSHRRPARMRTGEAVATWKAGSGGGACAHARGGARPLGAVRGP